MYNPSKALWRTVGAAVAGPHKGDLGCQDAWLLQTIPTRRGDVVIAALADGAGSARRGGDAARWMVQALVGDAIDRVERKTPRHKLWTLADSQAAFAAARASLEAEIARHPDDRRQWGTTALLAVLTPDATVLARIGDGGFALRRDQTWDAPLWPEMTAYVNVTEFVTHPDVRVQAVRRPAADALVMFSDGLQPLALDYAARAPFVPFCGAVLRELERATDLSVLETQLTTWLQSDTIRQRADDDVSLVMALRTP